MDRFETWFATNHNCPCGTCEAIRAYVRTGTCLSCGCAPCAGIFPALGCSLSAATKVNGVRRRGELAAWEIDG